MTSTEPRVTVEEVFGALGQTHHLDPAQAQELKALGVTPALDWAGRPTISVDEARTLVERIDQRRQGAADSWDTFVRECEQWKAGRTAAVNAAYREGRENAPDWASHSKADDHARAIADEAGREYERSTPRPAWQGVPGWGNNCPLQYVRDDELTPVVGRVREAIRRRGEASATTAAAATDGVR
jgi:hypothetical protein